MWAPDARTHGHADIAHVIKGRGVAWGGFQDGPVPHQAATCQAARAKTPECHDMKRLGVLERAQLPASVQEQWKPATQPDMQQCSLVIRQGLCKPTGIFEEHAPATRTPPFMRTHLPGSPAPQGMPSTLQRTLSMTECIRQVLRA